MATVNLTDKAIGALRKIMADQDLPAGAALRIGVKGGGCSGFSYSLGFDEGEATEKDEQLEIAGIPVYVDQKSLMYLDGITVDYHEDIMQKGFVFNNPKATATCGCGTSFSV